MKTVKDACELQPNALSIKLSDQVEQLDELITMEGDGSNNPDHFFWGEIAHQLGKGDRFRPFWTGGPKAPDEKDWLKLFEGDQPVLTLLDEMPATSTNDGRFGEPIQRCTSRFRLYTDAEQQLSAKSMEEFFRPDGRGL